MESVGAIDGLVARVTRVEGDTIAEFTMTEDKVELGTDGTTVGVMAAFPSKMSV
jgi:hypothetical protein